MKNTANGISMYQESSYYVLKGWVSRDKNQSFVGRIENSIGDKRRSHHLITTQYIVNE